MTAQDDPVVALREKLTAAIVRIENLEKALVHLEKRLVEADRLARDAAMYVLPTGRRR